MASSGAAIEMPRYKCHKEVHALKIKDIRFDWEDAATDGNRETDGSAVLSFFEERYAPIRVGNDFVHKHLPTGRKDKFINGYYVVYSDGYASWSPEQAFEEGYTLVS